MQTNQTAPHHPLRLSLPLSPLLLVSVSVQIISARILSVYFSVISVCLQKRDIRGSVFTVQGPAFSCFSPCFLSCALWRWRCLSLWGPSSSIPMTALYLMSLKMHALLAGKNEKNKDGKPEVENQLSWNGTTSLGEGKHCAHWGTELLWREGERGHICLGYIRGY